MLPKDSIDWLSAQEAAELLGLSRPRIHQLVSEGSLEGIRIAGRLLVSRHSLQTFEAQKSRRLPSRQPITLERLRKQRARIRAVASRRGARDICVFGSVARGEAGPGSDIDFLVEMEAGRNALDIAELIVDLEELLGCSVDVVSISSPSPTAERIRREAIAL